MYDEVNSTSEHEENNNLYGTTPEPIDSEIEEAEYETSDEVVEDVSYGMTSEEDEIFQEEVNHGNQDSVTEDSSSFYHYGYDHLQEQNKEYSQDIAITPKEKDKKKRNLKGTIWPKLAVSAAVALVFGIVGGAAFQATNYIGGKLTPKEAETQSKIESAGTVNSTGEELEDKKVNAVPVSTGTIDISQVAENCMPSIVAITTVSVQQVQSMFFGTTEQEEEGSGSGIIVAQNDSELLIATNNHVVAGANVLSVCFTVDVDEDIQVVEGQIKGTDPDRDLAIVAVALKDIPDEVKNQIKVIEMGDSENLKVGQQVVAIGNALGYGQSVTVGYVSALNREVTVDNITNNLIQTDAAINFGNSGGALLNTNGQLIGINSVKAAATGVEGMGYAIPINTASPILSDLMDRTTRSKVSEKKRGYMGVTLADVSNEAKEVYDMPSGAFVYTVEEGSPAETAGMKKGDIITKVDGIAIGSRDDVLARMEYYKAGETIDLIVQSANDGEYVERTVSITLGSRPESLDDTKTNQQAPPEYSQDDPYSQYEQGMPYGEGDFDTTPFQEWFPEFFDE